MLQRFASALFGGGVEELSQSDRAEGSKEEEEEDWILVDYLGESVGGVIDNRQEMMSDWANKNHKRSVNNLPIKVIEDQVVCCCQTDLSQVSC